MIAFVSSVYPCISIPGHPFYRFQEDAQGFCPQHRMALTLSCCLKVRKRKQVRIVSLQDLERVQRM